MSQSPTDRITKTVYLAAPIERVWRAIADAREFGRWFGVQLEGDFAPGRQMRGAFGDFEAMKTAIAGYEAQAGLEHRPLQPPGEVFCTVEQMVAPRLFSFRWIPYGIDAEADPATETPTLVEFRLEAEGSGTRLTVEESGFDAVPASRRARAFKMNDGGWEAQAENVRRHVEG